MRSGPSGKMIENPTRSMYSVRKMTPSESARFGAGADEGEGMGPAVDTKEKQKRVGGGTPRRKRKLNEWQSSASRHYRFGSGGRRDRDRWERAVATTAATFGRYANSSLSFASNDSRLKGFGRNAIRPAPAPLARFKMSPSA